MVYVELLVDSHIRNPILERDNYQCQRCGIGDRELTFKGLSTFARYDEKIDGQYYLNQVQVKLHNKYGSARGDNVFKIERYRYCLSEQQIFNYLWHRYKQAENRFIDGYEMDLFFTHYNQWNLKELTTDRKLKFQNIYSYLNVHHKNKNHNDNRPENLIILCTQCHQMIHRKFFS